MATVTVNEEALHELVGLFMSAATQNIVQTSTSHDETQAGFDALDASLADLKARLGMSGPTGDMTGRDMHALICNRRDILRDLSDADPVYADSFQTLEELLGEIELAWPR
jgi:hypothetical protein